MKRWLIATIMPFLLAANISSARQTEPPPGACLQNDTNFTTADGGCKDLQSGLVWSQSPPDHYMHWKYANNTYCPNLTEGGVDDWRLPARDELVTLASHNPGAYLQFHGQFGLGRTHWSSTKASGSKHYHVDLEDGGVYSGDQFLLTRAVCVRRP
jgi:hypothetical protein